ncbi:MAG: IS1634 family transposase [Patescibacteria group bacterium]
MYHIRRTKTSSRATAVQVVEYIERKLVVANHIGSAKTNDELSSLLEVAKTWIEKHDGQKPLFVSPSFSNPLDKYEYIGIRYAFIYEALHKVMLRFEFTSLGGKILHDLVVMRIIEPASKLQSLILLEEYFGICHRRQSFYESLPKFVKFKDVVEKLAVKRAKEEFGFDFSLVFYDVTTLYYESFESDELRKPGFSKDNKSQQPQIVLGLVVNIQGFPVSYEIFEGNKFEGHTLIPVIKAFKEKHSIPTLTVVADAAMISQNNVKALEENDLNYIVGARMGNISPKLISGISCEIGGKDKATMRIKTDLGNLVCDFSQKRYAKDKREMEKQVKKAENLISDPAKAKRAKFVKSSATAYELNKDLLEKAKLLLGIKGYYTNLGEDIDNQTIINHYHSLWHVEQAFRVAKSDLSTRPIFHFKKEAIQTHILICFMALAVSKYMEIKTKLSIKRIISTLRRVTDAVLVNKITSQKTIMRMNIHSEAKEILEKIGLQY